MLAHGDKLCEDDGTVPQSAIKCKMLVMTTHENYAETVEFFAKNNYFGGAESNFIFFKQSMLPAVSLEGKILMKSRGEICLAPNGNGALLNAVVINQEVKSYV